MMPFTWVLQPRASIRVMSFADIALMTPGLL